MINEIIENMPDIRDFDYWFQFENKHTIKVRQVVTSLNPIKPFTFNYPASDIHEIPEDVFSDFMKFQKRPEFISIYPEFMSSASISDVFDIMLLAVCLSDAFNKYGVGRADEVGMKQYTKATDWLRSTDFYDAPASTKYHGSYEHGLLVHTLDVVEQAIDLLNLPKFETVNMFSAMKCALVHDWCKINQYEKYDKWAKDDNGNWVTEAAYRWKDSAAPLGHGTASLFIANRIFSISLEEAAAIRWHMSHWRVCDDEVGELQQANETYPLVHLLQFADQLSITKY